MLGSPGTPDLSKDPLTSVAPPTAQVCGKSGFGAWQSITRCHLTERLPPSFRLKADMELTTHF